MYKDANNFINNRNKSDNTIDYTIDNEELNDISNNLNSQFNKNKILIEKSLKSSGIYIDYYNQIVTYFKEYIKNYITYILISYTRLYHKAKKENNIEQSKKYLQTVITIRNLLQKHFGGNNL
jgi:hypothetical protein